MNKQFDPTSLRYIIYARKSTEQDDRQAYSLDDQLRISREIARERRLRVVGEYQESMSAKEPGRPIFNQMMERIAAGEADAILAWMPDRLARNAVDGGFILHLLDKQVLRHLAFANFWFENTSQGRYQLQLAFAYGKLYSDNLSENVKRGLMSRVLKGIYPRRAKVGYTNHPKTHEIVPDPATFHLIAQVFERYVEGDISFSDIGRWAYDQGLRSYSGGVPSGSRMQDILTDPFYYGHFDYAGERYEGIHEPAITKELFDKAQLVMVRRGKPQTFKKAKKEFAFRGLLHCGECGFCITAETQKGHNYYRCTKRRRDVKCQQPFVREENLAVELKKVLSELYSVPEDWYRSMLGEIDGLEKEERSQAESLRSEFETDLHEIQTRLGRLVDLVVAGDIDRAEYRARKEVLLNKKAELYDRQRHAADATPKMRFEPLRRPLELVLERKNALAGDDLLQLRSFAAEVGSNWKLDSRNLLWDWKSPFAVLAKGGVYADWLGTEDSNLD